MRVRMKSFISGTRDGVDWPGPGEELDVPDAEAVELLNAGLAEAAPEKSDVETADVETTPKRRGRA
jgi:hypothetical protein